MEMELVGYRLKDIETGEYVNQWGGVSGLCPSAPPTIILKNGDHACGPKVGENYDGYILEEWFKEKPVVIPDITVRQFFQMAATENLITKEEALAAVQSRTVPAMLQTIIDGIQNENDKFAAQMLFAGAITFNRDHPLVEVVKTTLGWTDEQINSFFISAATL